MWSCKVINYFSYCRFCFSYQTVIWCLLLLCGAVGAPDDSTDFQKILPVQVIWAVEGKEVDLPCDVTPPTPRDSVSMILWFKDAIGIPLYSLDARGGNLNEANHLAITNDDLGSRSYFVTDEEPSRARLRIRTVRPSDEGVFRCRVDFTNSPTRNFKVNLTLVVQPSEPRIFDAQGHELQGSAGPFLQGHELFLSCQVTGGRPKPSVTWWQNGTLIDSVVDSSRDKSTTVNQLLVSRVTRSLWGAKLECRTTAHHGAGYRTKEVPILVYLTPQKVKISAPTDLMSTRMPQLCRCETSGSYPPAKIVWLLGNRLIKNSSVTVSQTDDSTISVLTLQPTPDDDGKELVCRADNPRFPGGSMQDSRTVRVAFPPKAVVHFQSGAGSTPPDADEATLPPLKEGGHVRLVCKTVAVPPAFKFTWYHNGHLVEFNETAGTLPSDHVLELRGLDRSNQGDYACAAGNVEGETLSEPLRLKIQYAPRCREGHNVLQIGAVPQEQLLVKCHVDAFPSTVKFSWTYNNSRDVLPVHAANRMNNNGVISQLQFTPGAGELGTLACWASNTVGRQKTPCLFHLMPAKLPSPPHDCAIRKPCDRCVEVICEASEDGGPAQSYVLEVNEVSALPPSSSTTLSDQGARPPPVLRLQEPEPVFRVHALDPLREYNLAIYAQNARGRSEPPVQLANVRVTRVAVAAPEGTRRHPTPPHPWPGPHNDEKNVPALEAEDKSTENRLAEPTKYSIALILGALISAASLVVVGVVAIVIVVLRKRRTPVSSPASSRRPKASVLEDFELREDVDHGFGEGFQRRSIEWRERNVRASLYLHDSDGRPAQHITIGPDLILSPVSFTLHQQRLRQQEQEQRSLLLQQERQQALQQERQGADY